MEEAAAGTATITLLADGKTSESVRAGTTVTLSEHGTVPSSEAPFTIKVVGSSSGGNATYTCTMAPCQQQVSQSSASTWRYQATVYGKSGNALATSGSVSVAWTAPPSASISISSSGAGPVTGPQNPGPGSTTYYYTGVQNGTTTCGGAAVHDTTGICDLNQSVNVQSNGATITATVSQPLASGQKLVIVYDSGNAADPEFQKCLPGYSVGLGCVIAAATGQSTQVTIPIPTSKGDFGGLHYLEMAAEAYPATQPVAWLDLALCENGSCG